MNDITDIQKAVQEQTRREAEEFGGGPEISSGPAQKPARRFKLSDIETAIDHDQAGLSRMLFLLLRGEYLFDHASGDYYRWAGNYWARCRCGEILHDGFTQIIFEFQAAYNELLADGYKASQEGNKDLAARIGGRAEQIKKMLRRLQRIQYRKQVVELAACGLESLGYSGQGWDANNMLFACVSGVIDLATGRLRPGKPEDFIKTASQVIFTGIDTPAPTWEQFLIDVFDSQAVVDYLHRFLGYCMTGETRDHVLNVFFGKKGRNAKSVLLRVLGYILGTLCRKIPSGLLLNRYNNHGKSDAARENVIFQGLRLAFASEVPKDCVLDGETAKGLSGEDEITCRPAYAKDFITFLPTFKTVLLCNDKPRIIANDDALWHRIVLIDFPFSFVDEPSAAHEKLRDPFIYEKIIAEASGVLAWLVRGAMLWNESGLQIPDCVRANTKSYRDEEDLIKIYIADCLDNEPAAMLQISPAYKTYQLWAKEAGFRAINKRNFANEMKSRVSCYDDGHGRTMLDGLSLKPEWLQRIEAE